MLPKNYLESRDQFIDIASRLRVAVRSIPYQVDEQNEHGLTVDTAYLGDPDASALIVIASGTHGVEGYAGAACQLHFMKNHGGFTSQSDIGFLLVHAVNPWGYHFDRRVTHEGVDLNRNFIQDFPSASTRSKYDAFHASLVTRFQPLPAGWWNELRLFSSAISKGKRRELQAAITEGQYQYPDGLFYGGQAQTQARMIWESIITAHCDRRSCVALLDIHTGLGKRGTAELISYLPDHSKNFQEMSLWFQGDLRSMQGGESVTSPVIGTLTEGFDRIAKKNSYAIGLEFGTCAPVRILNALRLDAWAHKQSGTNAKALRDAARRKMKQAFFPDYPEWHSQITAHFDKRMAQLIAGLSSFAAAC